MTTTNYTNVSRLNGNSVGDRVGEVSKREKEKERRVQVSKRKANNCSTAQEAAAFAS